MFIYLITNKINGKQYVGLTKKKISKRIAQHVNAQTYIGKALRRHGIDSFEISIIDEEDSIDALRKKEKHWIAYYGCKCPNGYNLTDGGDGVFGYKHTPERLQKISKAIFGITRSEETKRRMSLAQRGNRSGIGNKSRLGKHTSDETKDKIRRFHLGKVLSEETKAKISNTRKERKIGLGNKYSTGVNLGRILSESHRQKIRDGNLRAWILRRARKANEQIAHNNHSLAQL